MSSALSTATGSMHASAAPVAPLTCLRFAVVKTEPARWCSALRSLSMLRALRIHGHSLDTFPVHAFSFNMHALHALEALHISMHEGVPMASMAVQRLIRGCTRTPALSSLTLERCFHALVTAERAVTKEVARDGAEAFVKLGTLPWLTRLRLSETPLSNSVARGPLAAAVRGMCWLRELALDDCKHGLALAEASARGGGLLHLQALEVMGPTTAQATAGSKQAVARLTAALLGSAPAARAAVTRLALSVAGEDNLSDLPALVAALPGLKTVQLPGNGLGVAGCQVRHLSLRPAKQ